MTNAELRAQSACEAIDQIEGRTPFAGVAGESKGVSNQRQARNRKILKCVKQSVQHCLVDWFAVMSIEPSEPSLRGQESLCYNVAQMRAPPPLRFSEYFLDHNDKHNVDEEDVLVAIEGARH